MPANEGKKKKKKKLYIALSKGQFISVQFLLYAQDVNKLFEEFKKLLTP